MLFEVMIPLSIVKNGQNTLCSPPTDLFEFEFLQVISVSGSLTQLILLLILLDN